MLLAHPSVLEGLVEEYTALAVLGADQGDEQARRRLADVTYTLCVATGTRDVDSALVAARFHLPGARPEDDSVLPRGSAATRPALRL